MSATPRFDRLARHFLSRLADYELVAPGAEPHQTAVTGLSLLAALNFCIAVMFAGRELFAPPAYERVRAQTMLDDASLLISLTMLATALASALAWDAFFPDKRDSMSLGSLPLRPSLLTQARVFAILLYLAIVVLATNVATGPLFSFLAAPQGGFWPLVRSAAGWILALAASAVTILFLQLVLQAALLALLPYAAYQRISSLLQLAVVLGAFLAFFLTPGASAAAHVSLRQGLWHVPWWFCGLYAAIRGGTPALPSIYAQLGIFVPLLLFLLGLNLCTALDRRLMRKVCEQSDQASLRVPWLRFAVGRFVNTCMVRDQRAQATFWFVARTTARNRRHRMLLAITAAIGFAWAGQTLASAVGAGWSSMRNPGPALLAVPLELIMLLVIGLRALFGLPVDPQANWSFRIADRGSVDPVRSGALRFLAAVAVIPIALLPLPVYVMLWGWTKACFHCAFVGLAGLAVLMWLMRDFDKMPYACTMLPEKRNVRVKFGVWVVSFIFFCWFISTIELALMNSTRAMIVSLALLAATTVFFSLRHRQLRRGTRLCFEETGQPGLQLLQLEQ